eukprot:Skav223114  [mRNA]  locus=scaffold419:780734:785107:- [translate_table: standard]
MRFAKHFCYLLSHRKFQAIALLKSIHATDADGNVRLAMLLSHELAHAAGNPVQGVL